MNSWSYETQAAIVIFIETLIAFLICVITFYAKNTKVVGSVAAIIFLVALLLLALYTIYMRSQLDNQDAMKVTPIEPTTSRVEKESFATADGM